MCLLKLGASSLLVATMASALAGQSAFAADCSTPIDATAGSASCTITVNALNSSGALTFSGPSTITAGPPDPATHISDYSFPSTLIDNRSSNAGWSLLASMTGTGLTNGTDSIFPTIDSTTFTPTTIGSGNCSTTSSSAITLSATDQAFLTDAGGGLNINCSYANDTHGSINFTGLSTGSYTGTLNITLQNHP